MTNQITQNRQVLNLLGSSLLLITIVSIFAKVLISNSMLASSLFLISTSILGIAVIFYVYYKANNTEQRSKARKGLYLFSFLEGLSMASLIELHPALGSSVALAFIITSLLLTVGYKYAMNTKYDLYALYKYLFPVLIGLIVFSIAGMIFTLPGIFYLFLSLVGAGMFFLYLITDIQTLLSKETQNTPEIIAITLLIDILGLFKNILFLLDGLDD